MLPDALPHLFYSRLLADYPVTCVFTGKPISYGGPGVLPDIHWQKRRHLCQQLHVPADRLRMPSQVHGAAIAVLADDNWSNHDAVIVDKPGHPVACQYADCVPVVLYAPQAHVGAVIHAGWRGTAQRVAAKTATQLMAHYQLSADALIAVIGPAIDGCCFEVGPDVVTALANSLQPVAEPGSADASTYLQHRLPDSCMTGVGSNGNPKVNVKTVNQLQLQALGISQIEVLPQCTHCNNDLLWSHRRGDAGRQVALLCLN